MEGIIRLLLRNSVLSFTMVFGNRLLLANGNELSGNQHKRKLFVEAGACVSNRRHVLHHCALEAKFCSSVFLSSLELHDNALTGGFSKSAHRCPEKAKDVQIGRCDTEVISTDTSVCSNTAESCPSGLKYFMPHDWEHCTIAGDKNRGALSRYGRCTDNETGESTCLWDRDACPSSFIWEPVKTSDDFCPCSKVRTGACHSREGGKDRYYCAVSADACDKNSVYFTHKALEWQSPDIECYLCEDTDVSRILALAETKTEPSSSYSHQFGLRTGLLVAAVAVALIAKLVITKSRSRRDTLREENLQMELPELGVDRLLSE